MQVLQENQALLADLEESLRRVSADYFKALSNSDRPTAETLKAGMSSLRKQIECVRNRIEYAKIAA